MSTQIYRQQEREEKRLLNKELILSVAKQLFLDQGFFNTHMAEIADLAKISRKTLYRYFSSKEEIAMEIELSIFETLLTVQNQYIQNLQGSGYEKLSRYLEKLDELVDEYHQLVRFTGLFDFYMVGDYPNQNMRTAFIDLIQKVDQPFILFIQEGLKDGSIVSDLDVNYLARTIANSFLSLAQRITTRQSQLDQELNIDSRQILSIQRALFLKALKG
jgi:AcrR family transcriptional regulator